jgi:hypothetical protein
LKYIFVQILNLLFDIDIMLYTIILTTIYLFSKKIDTTFYNKADIEEGLEIDVDYNFNIPDYYSTQEQLDKLV